MRFRVNAGRDGLADLLPWAGPRRRINRRSRRRESKRSQTYRNPLPNHATIVARLSIRRDPQATREFLARTRAR
jgi:hypothetical protein